MNPDPKTSTEPISRDLFHPAGHDDWSDDVDPNVPRTAWHPTDDSDDSGTYGSSGNGSTTDSSSSTADGSGTDTTDQAPVGGPGHQGWDGSVYWFQNSSGVWRYTAHYDIYLSRISSSDSHDSSSSSSSSSAPAATRSSHETPAATASAAGIEPAVQFALAQLGKPFVMGGNGPNAYDCSGLIQQSFQRAGISLPRIANDQYEATIPIGSGQLRRGDLLFWSYDSSASDIHHGALYLGGNQYIEAAHPGTDVRISTLNHGNWPTHTSRP